MSSSSAPKRSFLARRSRVADPEPPAGGPGWPHQVNLMWTLVAVILAALAVTGIIGSKEIYTMYQLKQEEDRLVRFNQGLRDENERLLKTIDRMQNDQELLEDIIRKELNFVKKNEVIYQLRSDPAAHPTPSREPSPVRTTPGKTGPRR